MFILCSSFMLSVCLITYLAVSLFVNYFAPMYSLFMFIFHCVLMINCRVGDMVVCEHCNGPFHGTCLDPPMYDVSKF